MPAQVQQAETIALATGYHHTCAGLISTTHSSNKESGLGPEGLLTTVMAYHCWGSNTSGQTDAAQEFTHLNKRSGIQDKMSIKILSAGNDFTCGSSNLSINCVGSDTYAQSSPPKVGYEIAALSSGAYHSCALGKSPPVKCWGKNNAGQSTIAQHEPKLFKIQLGYEHSCAISDTLSLACWGSDRDNQFNVAKKLFNVRVMDLTLMMHNTCAQDIKYNILCATGTTMNVVEHTNGLARMISVSGTHVCYAKLKDKDYKLQFVCKEVSEQEPEVLHVGGLNINVIQVDLYMDHFKTIQPILLHSAVYYQSLGESNSCILYTKPQALCYGKNRKGINNIPVELKNKTSYISTNYSHSCAIIDISIPVGSDSLFTIKCWGENTQAQCDPTLPNANHDDNHNDKGQNISNEAHMAATTQKSSNSTMQDILKFPPATGLNFSCVFYNSKSEITNQKVQLHCFGNNKYNQLNTPWMENLTQFALGSGHACVIHNLNKLYCWGANGAGQADSPMNYTYNHTYSVSSISSQTKEQSFYKVASGFQHSCGLSDSLSLHCWGWTGPKGTGGGVLKVPKGLKAVEVALGYSHSCIISITRQIKCWGTNDYGQLDVQEGVRLLAKVVYGGWYHNCTQLNDGQVYCWGKADKGQIHNMDYHNGD